MTDCRDAETGATHHVGVLPGDGIGPEVVAAAVQVLDAAESRWYFRTRRSWSPLGTTAYLEHGGVEQQEVDRLAETDAVLLGAIGDPRLPAGVLERELLLRLRREFDLYANLRPVRLRPGVLSPLRSVTPAECDLLVVRENTESLYCNAGGAVHVGGTAEIATQESINSRHAVDRVLRFAFEAALERRRHVTLVHKVNVLEYAGGLWQRRFDAIAAEYPDIATAYVHVDAACLYLVTDPGRYDVVVTDNLFGDIFSDLGAGIQGGIGLSASANLDPTRCAPSLFEPIHGSAPDIAGRGVADPVGAILSLALLLDFLGEKDAAQGISDAVDDHLLARAGGPSGATVEVGADIAARVVGPSVPSPLAGRTETSAPSRYFFP
ncbi:3-isopropylmalate dehydrogenase [Nocardioides sp. L-11A]|uniref:3-isopropylmalate dehydrogenase n=1 Tax=Nocardioides sp. L-11A TaxID=3043848 RepID=UPI00249C3EF0|nr:3-isopropylmalate dehydrogenase [Nocardioides sp. L-11A]